MRLALVLTAVLIATPAWADVPRCMAMAHVRTSDRSGALTLRDAETVGPVLRVESDTKGLWLCDDRHHCWPATDFDIITPCAPEVMQGKSMTLR